MRDQHPWPGAPRHRLAQARRAANLDPPRRSPLNPILALLLRVPLHGMGLLVSTLPRSWEMALGAFLGRFALIFATRHARVARENLARCFPDLTLRETPTPAAGELRALRAHGARLAHMFAPMPGHFRSYTSSATSPSRAMSTGKRHARGARACCSWAFAHRELGVRRVHRGHQGRADHDRDSPPEAPAWLHDWMEKVRLSVGVRATYQPRTLPDRNESPA